jgi:hypothetical protein
VQYIIIKRLYGRYKTRIKNHALSINQPLPVRREPHPHPRSSLGGQKSRSKWETAPLTGCKPRHTRSPFTTTAIGVSILGSGEWCAQNGDDGVQVSIAVETLNFENRVSQHTRECLYLLAGFCHLGVIFGLCKVYIKVFRPRDVCTLVSKFLDALLINRSCICPKRSSICHGIYIHQLGKETYAATSCPIIHVVQL